VTFHPETPFRGKREGTPESDKQEEERREKGRENERRERRRRKGRKKREIGEKGEEGIREGESGIVPNVIRFRNSFPRFFPFPVL
jgi:hypothetical protein